MKLIYVIACTNTSSSSSHTHIQKSGLNDFLDLFVNILNIEYNKYPLNY